jgi:MYXO-CTERM domain-containing protein
MRSLMFLVLLGVSTGASEEARAAGPPEVSLSGGAFGLVGAGEAAIHHVAVENLTPTTPLVVSAASLSGDPDSWFSFAAATCDRATACLFNPPLSITSPARWVPLRCAPPAGSSGTRSATLTVASNAGTGTGSTVVTCSAAGGVVSVTPGSHLVDFGLVNLSGSAATSVVRISNPGPQPITTSAGATVGPDLARFSTTSLAPATIPPGGRLDISVSYKPIVERSRTDPDVAEIEIPATTSLGTDVLRIALRGRGGATHASIASVPTFADSFTNPGPAAQILPIVVANTGEAVLAISAASLTGAPVWKLMNPDPVEIPGGTTYGFLVRFTPTAAGPAPVATFRIDTSDPLNPSLSTVLHGNGMRRNVTATTPVIDLRYAAIGTTTRLSEGDRGELLRIENLDNANAFEVREIRVTGGDGAFDVLSASNVRLGESATRGFDVAFTPPYAGDFEATASVYLDADPVPQATVTLRGQGVFVEVNGGGCASTPEASLGLLVIVAALLLRRRKLALLCSFSIAHADTRNLDVSIFDPTPSTSGAGFEIQSPEVGKNGAWATRFLVSYANNPLVLRAEPNDNESIQHRTTLSLGGAYAFGGRLEVGARMPLYLQSGENLSGPTRFGESPPSGAAFGNLTLHGKVRTSRHRLGPGLVVTGLGLALGLPTATDQQFAGSGTTSMRGLALASFAPTILASRLVARGHAGAVVRATAEYHDIRQRSGLLWGMGASYRVRPDLSLAAEMFGEIVPGGRRDMTGGSKALHTIETLVGAHYHLQRHLDVGIAVGRGITGPGAPAVRGVVEVTFSIAPPPLASMTRSEADDADRDGIADEADRCPVQAEDIDGYVDEDGCPDLDNDHDGIPDSEDKCPGAAEDKDGFEDEDGCPDTDNDRDGIADNFDHCRGVSEVINGIDDDDGCPDVGQGLVTIEADRLVVAAQLTFTPTGEIATSSFNALGQLAAMLRAHPELVKIRVDAQPPRAQAVVSWLTQWGIAADRLESAEATGEGVSYVIVKRQ